MPRVRYKNEDFSAERVLLIDGKVVPENECLILKHFIIIRVQNGYYLSTTYTDALHIGELVGGKQQIAKYIWQEGDIALVILEVPND